MFGVALCKLNFKVVQLLQAFAAIVSSGSICEVSLISLRLQEDIKEQTNLYDPQVASVVIFKASFNPRILANCKSVRLSMRDLQQESNTTLHWSFPNTLNLSL